MTARKAVDPIIASLLLIAIAVAAGIIVYVYVNSLAGGLTQSGGQQVTDQISVDAWNFQTSTLSVTIRDVGSSSVTVGTVFFDGQPASITGCGSQLTPTVACTFTLTSSAAAGTAHTVKIVDTAGGTAVLTVIAGRTG